MTGAEAVGPPPQGRWRGAFRSGDLFEPDVVVSFRQAGVWSVGSDPAWEF